MLRFLLPLAALLVVTSGCVVRTTRTVRTNAAVVVCDPAYPCSGSYYWDEWREVYVYYDGYRYIDCTGRPGEWPLPPAGVVYYAPPAGYVPPSSWIPPRGTYLPPVGYVRHNRAPPSWVHDARPVPGGGYNNGYNNGSYPPPPPGGST
ncbi:MAG: hypothetical protein JNK82_27245, partial [Myxococcaceae bacterium]|nr:hypothetical protein [Myxococcaceae bacterium]